MSGNLSKSAFFEGGMGHFERRSPTTVGVRVAEWLPFRVVWKYPQCIIWFCHNRRVWQMDGQTDGRTNRITTPKTVLAYARAVKTNQQVTVTFYFPPCIAKLRFVNFLLIYEYEW